MPNSLAFLREQTCSEYWDALKLVFVPLATRHFQPVKKGKDTCTRDELGKSVVTPLTLLSEQA